MEFIFPRLVVSSPEHPRSGRLYLDTGRHKSYFGNSERSHCPASSGRGHEIIQPNRHYARLELVTFQTKKKQPGICITSCKIVGN